ncbi:hypothetical protein GA0074695_2700 [Micromonospora viridifaciens]|uniref:Uncharacterized protein n=1 Tax=Micromonospora viridifaciens TaxID=1881 RepID=A0A1C4WSS3_MICVI|nr:hypothetical protein [Micromonospora viridifaciens]SCE98911.1 hypothetical protein GA0074695_2700 [Micromonospora viridifaciens]
MTRVRTLLTAAVTTTALTVAGCADDRAGGSGEASARGISPSATTATSAPTAPLTSRPSTSPSSETPRAGNTRKASQTNPPPDDRTGDLVPGRRTINGTVERAGDWIVLRTGDATWALLGRRAQALRVGSTATVTGTAARRPAGCPADHALSVYRAR